MLGKPAICRKGLKCSLSGETAQSDAGIPKCTLINLVTESVETLLRSIMYLSPKEVEVTAEAEYLRLWFVLPSSLFEAGETA